MINDHPPLPQKPIELADRAMEMLAQFRQPPIQPGHALPRGENWQKAFEASRRWNQLTRWVVGKPSWRSVLEIWQDPYCSFRSFRNRFEAGELSQGDMMKALRSRAYWASQFNPLAAATIFRTYCPKGGHILDPCSGWGDRLSAAMALDLRYVGFDANHTLQAGYEAQIQRYGDPDRHITTHAAFEDCCITESAYHLVFTSPPYERAEIYSGDKEQSHYRYANTATWVEGFLRPLMTKSAQAAVTGGYVIVNICNSRGLGDHARAIAEGLPISYEGFFTYPLGGGIVEPVYVWRKI